MSIPCFDVGAPGSSLAGSLGVHQDMSVLPVHTPGSLGVRFPCYSRSHRRIAFESTDGGGSFASRLPMSCSSSLGSHSCWWRLKLMAGCYGRLKLMAVSQMMLVAAQTYGRLLWPAQPYGRLPNDVVLAVIVNGMSRGSRKERTPTRKPKKSLPWILQTKMGGSGGLLKSPSLDDRCRRRLLRSKE